MWTAFLRILFPAPSRNSLPQAAALLAYKASAAADHHKYADAAKEEAPVKSHRVGLTLALKGQLDLEQFFLLVDNSLLGCIHTQKEKEEERKHKSLHLPDKAYRTEAHTRTHLHYMHVRILPWCWDRELE